MYLLLVLCKVVKLSRHFALKLDSDVCDSAIELCTLTLNATVKLNVFCVGVFLKTEDWEGVGGAHFVFG